MKILLVNPPVSNIREPIHDIPKFLNLGLATIFSELVSKTDHEIFFIDCKFERLNQFDLINKIEEINPEIIGFSLKSVDANIVFDLTKKIKRLYPNITLVAGGAHASAVKNDLIDSADIDHVFCGESEELFLDFLDKIERGETPEKVFQTDNFIINIPMVRWDILPKAEKYFVMSSRGCPFNCIFCMRVLGEKIRKRTSNDILKEFSLILKRNPKASIEFADETFTVDKDFAIKTLKKIKEKNLLPEKGLIISTRVDTLDKKTIRLLKKYGVRKIIVGIESGDEKILKNTCKGIQLDKALLICKEIRKNKIQLETNFIVGLPGENIKSVIKTAIFAAKTRSDNISVSIAVPYPGTRLHDMAKNGEFGYILRDVDWSEYNNELSGALESKRMSINSLRLAQLFIYVFSFLGQLRFIDFLRFCKKYRIEAITFLKNGVRSTNNI